tara:strand:+ start:7632 stop:8264 length:633 start_codon:yes stop_codon:yes gene_type:complete
MFKYWKYWLSAIVIVLLYVFSEGVPVDGVVSYGSVALAGAGAASAVALTDLLIKAIPGPKEKKRRKELEAASKKKAKGLSTTQRQGMLSEAVQNITGQEASISADLRRQAAATGGFGRSGRTQQLAGEQGKQRKQFMVDTGKTIQDASMQKLALEEQKRLAAKQALQADIDARKAGTTQATGQLTGTLMNTANAAQDYDELKFKRTQAGR